MKDETKKYISSIKDYLIQRYGQVHTEWQLMLDLLSDTYDEYLIMREELANTYYFDPETGRKNPLIASIKDARASIYKIVQHFGISPYADAKLRVSEPDTTDDFIESLTESND